MSSRSEFVQFHLALFSPGIQPGDRRTGSPTPIEVGSVRDGQYSRSYLSIRGGYEGFFLPVFWPLDRIGTEGKGIVG